jgi:hypothetical protein
MMKNIFSTTMPLKALVVAGTVLLAVSASIIFGLVDETLFYNDPSIMSKVVYTTGGMGLVIMILAGMYYFQYRYRL